MIKSIWKKKYIDYNLLDKSQQNQSETLFYTQNKNTIILESFLYKTICVYNGKVYIPLNITENMIGFKLGDFIFTKKRCVYKSKKGSKKNR